MSPIQNANVRGYADWQRTSNWDSGVLYSDTNRASAGGITTSVLDVSRYAYLSGADRAANSRSAVTVQWWYDLAGTLGAGYRQFVLDTNLFAFANYRLPNLGPFVQLTWAEIGAVAFSHTSDIIGTNRFHPLEFIPTQSQLIAKSGTVVGIGATNTEWPRDYYAGPVRIFSVAAAATLTFALQVENMAGGFDTVEQWAPGAGVVTQISTVTPPGAWRIVVINSGAATTYNLSVTQSQTGAL